MCILTNRDKNFDLAIKYLEMLGNYVFQDKETVKEKLKLNTNVSILDILATYLVLYRLPLLFNKEHNGVKGQLFSYYRLFKGLIGHNVDKLRNVFFLNTNKKVHFLVHKKKKSIKKVLFLGFKDIYFRDILSSIQSELNQNEDIFTYVINQKKNFISTLDSQNSIWNLLTTEDIKFVNVLLKENNKLKSSLLSSKFISEASNFKHLQINKTLLKNEISWILYREIPRLAPFIALAKRLFTNNNLSLLVTADDADQKCRVFTLHARIKKIDSIVVQQGLVRKDYPEWVYFSGSKIACMGKHSMEIINSQGVPKKNISITGSIETDRQIKKNIKGYTLFKSKNTSRKPKILFASQPYVHGAFISKSKRIKCISDIYKEFSRMDKIADILIKPHPNDNLNELKKINYFSKNFLLFKKSVSIADLIEECDVFVTMFSTSALQSICAGKPVIIADINNTISYNEYESTDSVWMANTRHDLREILSALITSKISDYDLKKKNKARKKFISERCYDNDGNASKRVSQLMLSMVRSD